MTARWLPVFATRGTTCLLRHRSLARYVSVTLSSSSPTFSLSLSHASLRPLPFLSSQRHYHNQSPPHNRQQQQTLKQPHQPPKPEYARRSQSQSQSQLQHLLSKSQSQSKSQTQSYHPGQNVNHKHKPVPLSTPTSSPSFSPTHFRLAAPTAYRSKSALGGSVGSDLNGGKKIGLTARNPQNMPKRLFWQQIAGRVVQILIQRLPILLPQILPPLLIFVAFRVLPMAAILLFLAWVIHTYTAISPIVRYVGTGVCLVATALTWLVSSALQQAHDDTTAAVFPTVTEYFGTDNIIIAIDGPEFPDWEGEEVPLELGPRKVEYKHYGIPYVNDGHISYSWSIWVGPENKVNPYSRIMGTLHADRLYNAKSNAWTTTSVYVSSDANSTALLSPLTTTTTATEDNTITYNLI